MTRPDLVVFDCDGVLVDSEVLQVGIEVAVLAELGWSMSTEELVRRWMGTTAAEQSAEIGERLGAEAAHRHDALVHERVHEVFERDLTEVAGITGLLDHVETAGIRSCVASSGTHERIRWTLGITGLWDRLDGRIFSAVEVEHGKPAPDLFLHAAARMGVPPSGCVVIEDSVAGVTGAVAAGMRCLGYGAGLAGPSALADAGAEVFTHMSDVPALLGVS